MTDADAAVAAIEAGELAIIPTDTVYGLASTPHVEAAVRRLYRAKGRVDAQPTALVVANAVFRAVETIGMPECGINLAHGVAYLANCAKDRGAVEAYGKAMEDVQRHGNLPIPMQLRNAPTKLMKNLGYHKGYKLYDKESYLPDKLKNKKYMK